MKDDVVMKMLRQVASGEVSVEDAREALMGYPSQRRLMRVQLNTGFSMKPLQDLLSGPASPLLEIRG